MSSKDKIRQFERARPRAAAAVAPAADVQFRAGSGAHAKAKAEATEKWGLLQLMFACGLAEDLLAQRLLFQRACLMDQAI